MNRKVLAIIPAAGMGLRMGANTPKQFLLLGDMPILAVTLKVFQRCNLIDYIVIVVPGHEINFCKKNIVDKYGFNKVYKVVAGGKRRQDSVRMGLYAAKEIIDNNDIVVIHDGVRPLVETSLIERAIKEAEMHPAIIVGVPAKDTVKEVDKNGYVNKTHNREQIWIIQTPQIFKFELIFMAHEQAYSKNWQGITDDSMLLENLGIPVKVIKGSERNIKITTPTDLELAKFLYSKVF